MRRTIVITVLWCCAAVAAAWVLQAVGGEPTIGGELAYWLIQPLPLVTRCLTFLIDLLGPRNLPEPASAFLNAGQLKALSGLAFVLYVGSVFTIARALRVFALRLRREPAG